MMGGLPPSRHHRLCPNRTAEILPVQPRDVRNRNLLRALGLAGAGIRAAAEALLIHLADHCLDAAVTFDLALRQVGQVGHLGGGEEHG